ncbi:MAG: flagellar biosynthesis protein FlhF [Eubacteriales bacterium]|nr:flagellar biosynthesis protein FlhF [Eubacteriales bacterium]
MIIKKFQAQSETEAIMLAKEDLGKDAIVMNIKTIKPKGLFRIFRKTLVEVTAAVDDVSEKKSANDKADGNKTSTKINAKIDEKLHPERKQEMDESKELEEKLSNLAMLLEKQIETQKTQKKNTEKEKKSEDKTDEKKKETLDKEEKTEQVSLKSKSIELIINQLTNNEVSYQYAKQLLDEITSAGSIRTLDDMLACVYQKIILKLGQTKPIIEEKGNKKPQIIFFMGPTGVGKTTTIAKLSSKLMLEEKKKIAIFTADTYRIAAVEQIKTYANILSIPVEVIYEVKDVEKALPKYKDYSYILIDTAGRSHKNKNQVDDLKKLYDSFSKYNILTYLVLSATTKYKDLKNITALYKDMSEYNLIFTKVDETDAVGNILNIKLDTGMPLSYISYGQNVPDDIEVMNPQVIAKQVLGGGESYGSGR